MSSSAVRKTPAARPTHVQMNADINDPVTRAEPSNGGTESDATPKAPATTWMSAVAGA
jgi:hypothetical protein